MVRVVRVVGKMRMMIEWWGGWRMRRKRRRRRKRKEVMVHPNF